MEFRGLLALAYKNQQKRDKEIKQLEELAKVKKQERFKELASARCSVPSVCYPAREKKEDSPKVVSRITPSGDSARPLTLSKAECGKNECQSNPSKRISVSVKGELVKKLDTARAPVPDCAPRPSETTSVNKKATKVKPSFTELLELAKKNVGTQQIKRKAFDDLIPCSADPGYRSSDNSVKSDPKGVSYDPKQPAAEPLSKHPTSRPPFVQKCSDTDYPNRISLPSGTAECNSTVVPPPAKTLSKVRGQLQKRPSHPTSPNSSDRVVQAKKPQKPTSMSSRSAIAMQLGSNIPRTGLTEPRVSSDRQKVAPVPSSNTKNPRSSSVPLTSKMVNSSQTPTIQKPQMSTKKLSDHQTLKLNATSNTNSREDQAKRPVTVNSIKKPNGVVAVASRRAVSPSPSLKRPPASRPMPVYPARGIAAQLGIKPPGTLDEGDYSYSEDDYESDDSFIDDSEAVESKEYARVIRDVHKALRFDPRKYKEVNPFDDLRSMEANYREIEKEEKRSARIAAQEDALELERDLERKRQKLMLRS
ncbi:hypothetical protein T265_09762 [Opisthorchis viverrini]|uniref:Uncharacterized protein n=1 Tax=Opisthorchis viverrini TaxID=6198 RepID=A0A074Z4N3_OPIVI|nr:hypothetical protein T265_09762 [Opisthorchis viverrini]KER22046.1 hypothetical protein T265_09762 [Opisthorchis viverrini]